MVFEKYTFESTTAFIKATQIKRDESDSQSLTKVLYHQNPLQVFKKAVLVLKSGIGLEKISGLGLVL